MKIKIKFKSKEEINFFQSCLTEMFEDYKKRMDLVIYFNSIELLKIIQKKMMDICFSPNKKFSICISPNHYMALDFLWSKAFNYYRASNVYRYNFFLQTFEQAKKGFDLLNNINVLSLKYDIST